MSTIRRLRGTQHCTPKSGRKLKPPFRLRFLKLARKRNQYYTPKLVQKGGTVLRKSARLQNQKSTKSEPNVDPQTACPFFRTLPREIRDMIFPLVLTSYEDGSRPRDIEALKANLPTDAEEYQKYRPGHFCFLRTDTALLRTCRAIYQETRYLPVAINTHTLWSAMFYGYFAIPDATVKYFKSMTSAQIANIQHLQVFAGPRALKSADRGKYIPKGVFAEIGSMRSGRFSTGQRFKGLVCPKTITLTIRRLDWQDWDRSCDKNFSYSLHGMLQNKHWANVFGGLKTLKMELEVEEKEKERLGPVVKALSNFIFEIGNGERLVAEQKIGEYTWTGPIMVNNSAWLGWQDTTIYVASIIWRSRSVREMVKTQSAGV